MRGGGANREGFPLGEVGGGLLLDAVRFSLDLAVQPAVDHAVDSSGDGFGSLGDVAQFDSGVPAQNTTAKHEGVGELGEVADFPL